MDINFNIKIIQKILSYATDNQETMSLLVDGTSMLPTIRKGDVVTIQKSNDYRKGEVVVFTYKEDLLIHWRQGTVPYLLDKISKNDKK